MRGTHAKTDVSKLRKACRLRRIGFFQKTVFAEPSSWPETPEALVITNCRKNASGRISVFYQLSNNFYRLTVFIYIITTLSSIICQKKKLDLRDGFLVIRAKLVNLRNCRKRTALCTTFLIGLFRSQNSFISHVTVVRAISNG